jgi:hypothetical protein
MGNDMPILRLTIIAVSVVAASGLTTAVRADEPPTFERQVRPILKAYCLDCHDAARTSRASSTCGWCEPPAAGEEWTGAGRGPA